MPVEVIDLLSSSPDIPAPRPPTKTTKTCGVPRPNPSPARALDYDIFDLTDVTSDNPCLPLPRKASDSLAIPLDDFDATADLFDDAFATRPAKRARVEPAASNKVAEGTSGAAGPQHRSTSGLGRATSNPAALPALKQSKGLRKSNSTVDPIQTSSDPFATPPRQGAKEVLVDLSKDDVSFGSSSPQSEGKGKGREKATVQKSPVKHPSSSPMFVSSQLPDELDSPKRDKKVTSKGKNPVGWDDISSSAPSLRKEAWDLDAQPARSALGKTRSAGSRFDQVDLADFSMSEDEDEDEFPDLDNIRSTDPKKKSASSKSNKGAVSKRGTGSNASTSTRKTAAERERERLDKAAAKDAEKRRKQQEREEAKALAEVNKVRTDKKVSTPEMLVDFPSSMDPIHRLQYETLLNDLHVESHSYDSPVPNVVKWRRKVKARYNDDRGQWEPIPQRIETEKHAMVIMPAVEFVDLALGAKGGDLEAHVLKMQRHYEGYTLIYLIEGLTPWMRKNRNARNRQFQSAVRNDASAAAAAVLPSSTQQRKRRDPKPPPQYIDEDTVEDALLQLQIHHGVLIHHTAAHAETLEWVAVFTQHISTIPYRHARDAVNAGAAFCMDSGQVRTGDNAPDTYLRMLQEIVRVTVPIAHGIAAEHPTVSELVGGLEKDGPLALERIRKSANKDGALSDRCVGQAMSRRLWKVFTSRDETSADI